MLHDALLGLAPASSVTSRIVRRRVQTSVGGDASSIGPADAERLCPGIPLTNARELSSRLLTFVANPGGMQGKDPGEGFADPPSTVGERAGQTVNEFHTDPSN